MIIGIYGSGGLGREVLDIVLACSVAKTQKKRVFFIDDFKDEQLINSVKVLSFEAFKNISNPENATISIAIGEPKVRHALRKKVIDSGYSLQTLVHPTSFIGTDTKIESGAIIQFGSFVSCNTIIGTNVLIQPNASIGHDSVIGNDSVLSPFVAISGFCTIGKRVYIGNSVPVREKVSIGADSIVGMGSVVMRNIPENVVALGNPARAMKENASGYVFKHGENTQ